MKPGRWTERAAMVAAALAAQAIARALDPGIPYTTVLGGIAIGAFVIGFVQRPKR